MSDTEYPAICHGVVKKAEIFVESQGNSRKFSTAGKRYADKW